MKSLALAAALAYAASLTAIMWALMRLPGQHDTFWENR